jgi:predicted nucleotidyltransferase component of viral defense system
VSDTHGKNLPASVKQRLMNHARQHRVDFNTVLVRYAMERLLFRLSESSHANDFYLKGAMLFVLWESNPHRPTKDMDLLFIPQHDGDEVARIFREIARMEVSDDGIDFDPGSVAVEEIREENAYGGLRVKLVARLGTGRLPLQIDVGLGDSVYPETDWAEFPALLDFPPPRIRAYPIETVVAEKYQAIVELGLRNSRMKDYYDIHYLLRKFQFNGEELHEAIRQTFERRKTDVPQEQPPGLSPDFAQSAQKQIQWQAFLRKNGLENVGDLPDVVESIEHFLMHLSTDTGPKTQQWEPDQGWTPNV